MSNDMNVVSVSKDFYLTNHKAKKWSIHPGVYVLVSDNKMYVGKATRRIDDRITRHKNEKDFWDKIIFISGDSKKFNETLLANLEPAILHELERMAANVVFDNKSTPGRNECGFQDEYLVEQIVEDFFHAIPLLFEAETFSPTHIKNHGTKQDTQKPVRFLSQKGSLKAEIELRNGVWYLIAGSQVAKACSPGAGAQIKTDHGNFVADINVQDKGTYYVTTVDKPIPSPNKAACVVRGYSESGNRFWADSEGRSPNHVRQTVDKSS